MSVQGIQARDDWPEIQMKAADGQSIASLAKQIGVHHEQLRRALKDSTQKKVTQVKRATRKTAQKVQETVQEAIQPVQEIAGTVTNSLPVPRKPRDLGEFSIESTIKEMRENQAILQEIAEEQREKSPYTAIAATNASNQAAAAILKAMVQYQVHSEKDITKHPAFNRMMTIIMQALTPFPEAAAALVLALEETEE